MVIGSFLTLEDEGTTFIRNVCNQRGGVTFQTTGILDKNYNKVKFLLSFIKHNAMRTNAKLEAVYNSNEFGTLALTFLYIKRLVAGFSQLAFRQFA